MSRVLVIPDIHNRTAQADRLIAAHGAGAERIVFLGDYFDDFGDGPREAWLTAEWLRGQMEEPRSVFLIGNHDLPYLASASGYHPRPDWPGFTNGKWQSVRQVLNGDSIDRFRLAAAEGNILITHAGIHPDLIPCGLSGAKSIAGWANAELERWLGDGRHASALLAVGRARGGVSGVGGCLWLDWRNEFAPIRNVRQIVGHTSLTDDATAIAGDNHCLDRLGGPSACARIEDGRIAVIEDAG